MTCRNHPARPATYKDSVPDSTVPGYNLNEGGYKTVFLCDECAARTRRDVGNTARLEKVK